MHYIVASKYKQMLIHFYHVKFTRWNFEYQQVMEKKLRAFFNSQRAEIINGFNLSLVHNLKNACAKSYKNSWFHSDKLILGDYNWCYQQNHNINTQYADGGLSILNKTFFFPSFFLKILLY